MERVAQFWVRMGLGNSIKTPAGRSSVCTPIIELPFLGVFLITSDNNVNI